MKLKPMIIFKRKNDNGFFYIGVIEDLINQISKGDQLASFTFQIFGLCPMRGSTLHFGL